MFVQVMPAARGKKCNINCRIISALLHLRLFAPTLPSAHKRSGDRIVIPEDDQIGVLAGPDGAFPLFHTDEAGGIDRTGIDGSPAVPR